MSYAPRANAPSDHDPGWVEWAESETVSRLRDQLSALRVERELRRTAEVVEAEVLPPTVDAEPRHTVAAMNAPPSPGDPSWHAWAEAQTVLRLRRPKHVQATFLPPPPPAPPADDLRVEIRPSRTIRIHHDNLKSVGL